ncbi:MAG: ribbon-helix-helix protein, CopG family [Nitrospirae bacterium]|nr:ribbon-helix-helix protein, CopG family [Nitrospirota bacterium]
MERQNVTLSLPRSLIRKAKALAVKRDSSLSELMRKALEEKVKDESGYQSARNKQIALMEKGLNLGSRGKITTLRDELHERR